MWAWIFNSVSIQKSPAVAAAMRSALSYEQASSAVIADRKGMFTDADREA